MDNWRVSWSEREVVERGLGRGRAADPAKHPSHCQLDMSRHCVCSFVCSLYLKERETKTSLGDNGGY